MKITLSLKELRKKGGAGSGNFGHSGRPGKIGGSSGGGAGGSVGGGLSYSAVKDKVTQAGSFLTSGQHEALPAITSKHNVTDVTVSNTSQELVLKTPEFLYIMDIDGGVEKW